jgi:lactoylglutathione lyase
MKYLHTMIRVFDLEKALDFFVNKLEFRVIRRKENEKGRFTLVFLCAKNDKDSFLELTYNWDQKQEYTCGRNFGHIAYQVDNIYEFCESLMKKGVILNRPPRDGYMAFIKSPDNISIEILQKGEPLEISEPWVSMPNIGEW